MTQRSLVIVSLFSLSLLAGACDKKQDTGGGTAPAADQQPATPQVDPVAKAKELFDQVCSTCHGANGKGDGAAAQTLDPKPRNYTDPAWQDSVTDDHIKEVITKGGQAVLNRPSAMTPYGSLPVFKQNPQVLDELVKIIRGFKGK